MSVERLTDAQKACLRLVSRGFQTKEIARELGISPRAVEDRIESARRHFGGAPRVQVARLLAEEEGGSRGSATVEPITVSAGPAVPAVERTAGLPQTLHAWLVRPLPANSWSAGQRLAAIGGIALLGLLALALLISAMNGLGAIIR